MAQKIKKIKQCVGGQWVEYNVDRKLTFDDFDDASKEKIEADTIDVQIWSSRGNIFRSQNTNTTLSCHVFKGGLDITNTLTREAFLWKKFNQYGEEEIGWLAGPSDSHGSEIIITDNSVFNRAVFTCEVDISRQYK